MFYYLVYNFKNSKFSTTLSAGQPVSLPAKRPGSASAMAPVFDKIKVTPSIYIT